MNEAIKNEISQKGIEQYLHEQQHKSMLRFLTCGSVDDGKSTLIGRLLHDAQQIYEDQLAALQSDSAKVGTQGGEIDLALLVDGLQAEREQGITIDVAYRYFSTAKRKFIIADTPGHEQYTRNMATGASTCDVAVILIDARKGVLTQTKRHSFIASLLGIRHFVVAVNKMDLVDWSEEIYERIRTDYLAFAKKLEGEQQRDIHFVPVSALKGDNVVSLSEGSPWFKGQPLLHLLENIQIEGELEHKPFRMPVQYVNRPNLDFRGFAGTISAGVVHQGDELMVLPSGKRSRVKSIVTFDGDLEAGFAGQAVTITLEDEIDISRGDVLVKPEQPAELGKTFLTHIVWMSEQALVPGNLYDIKLASKKTSGSVARIRTRIDVNTLEHSSADELALNEIAVCEVELTEAVAFDAYQDIHDTGSFIVIDRLTNGTVGAGMIIDALSETTANHQFSAFEIELNALIRKHFPHWEAQDIRKLLK